MVGRKSQWRSSGDRPPRAPRLVAERQQAADRLADLKVQEVNVNAQRARVTAEAGPALYPKLFGSDDTEAVVRLFTALLVLVLDSLAVRLTLAASE